MSETNLQTRKPNGITNKDKSPYFLTFGVIATMLFATGYLPLVVAFFGIFGYFIWKTFLATTPQPIRDVFEFYLSANDILRNDDRQWFGFEVQEVIRNGEVIIQRLEYAPPLVYFALGALYQKVGNYKSAVNYLAYIVENETSHESNYHSSTAELTEYVKILRKIERDPEEAPQTSAAIRSLERARKTRGKALLEESRVMLASDGKQLPVSDSFNDAKIVKLEQVFASNEPVESIEIERDSGKQPQSFQANGGEMNRKPHTSPANSKDETTVSEHSPDRKTISEVLRDLYDH